MYLFGLVYISAVAFYSISKQIFAPPSAEAVHEMQAVSCDDGAESLARALRIHATAHVQGTTHANDEAFFESWDRTYGALTARCETRQIKSLARLRHRIEITLRRWDREEGAAFARLNRASAPLRAEP